MLFASVKPNPRVQYTMKIGSKKMEGEVSLADFIDVKGWKALGNRLSDQKLTNVKEIMAKETQNVKELPSSVTQSVMTQDALIKDEKTGEDGNGKYQAGDTIEFDFG